MSSLHTSPASSGGLLSDALDCLGMVWCFLAFANKKTVSVSLEKPSRGTLGAIWDLPWACLGPVLERLGPVLGYLGPVLGHLKPFLGDLSPGLGLVERVTEGVTEVELRVTEVTGPLSD